MQLFEEDTAADLVCRGYSRDLIQQMIGVDVGYNGSKMSAETKGVDRVLYKVEHVCRRLGDSDVEAALELYSRRASKTEVLSRLGLHGENIVKLKRLFSELGFAEQFKQADRAQRKASMRSGMEQKYGTDNPFKLDQFQKQAEQTRQEKYGAKYTLAAGSALEAQARQRFRDRLSDDEFRSALAQKKAETNLQRLGVPVPAQSESVKLKMAQTQQSKVAQSDQDWKLFEEGSVLDLVCRGFSQQEVIDRTGSDPGGRCHGVRSELSGIDRFEYKIEHIRERIGADEFIALVQCCPDDLDVDQLKRQLGLPVTNRITISMFCKALGADEQYSALRHRLSLKSRSKVEQTNLQRYGSASPAGSEQVRAKMQQTTHSRYGVDNASQSEQIKQSKRETSLKNYGTAHPLQNAEQRAVRDATVRQKYGVENISQAEHIKQSKREKSLARYGVEATMLAPEVAEKISMSLRARYSDLPADGPVYPFQSQQALQNARDRVTEIYGVSNVFESLEVQAGIRQRLMDQFGVENVSQLPEVQKKRAATIMAEYGVNNVFELEEFQRRARETNLQKYGAEHPIQLEEFQQKARASSTERYGYEYFNQSEESRQRLSAQMQDPEVRAKINATKRANGSFHTSAVEDGLHQMLIETFGEDDVLTQYSDDRYSTLCDFYILSRDLFIELNGTWTHGGHWFDESSAQDQQKLAGWRAKSTAFYRNAEAVWTVADPKKRNAAAEHQLNYVVFWDGAKLLDAKLWLAMGAPDGADWQSEYSWIPDRDLSTETQPPKLQTTPYRARQAARAFNGEQFYCRELQLWDDQQPAKWGTVKGFLHSNRFEHMGRERGAGKLPDEISDFELLRGMGIAGMVRAYSTFDISVMLQVIEQHSPTKIYDPCAGWGERLFTAAAVGVEYQGVDINEGVVAGHQRMIEHYGLTQQSSAHGDAADVHSTDHDMVFTCPPYGDIEIYTDHGAENLDEEGFLSWWAQVVASSTAEPTKVFAYQINQKWRDRMNQVLLDAGWRLEEQIALGHQSSHFTRKPGASIKKEFEEVQVFVR